MTYSVKGGSIGTTFAHIISEQFNVLRDGDPDWYAHKFANHPKTLEEIEKVTLSSIILANGDLRRECLPSDTFFAR